MMMYFFFTVCGNENAQKEISALLPVGEGTINTWSPVSVSASVQLRRARETFYRSIHFQIVICQLGIDGNAQLIIPTTKKNLSRSAENVSLHLAKTQF